MKHESADKTLLLPFERFEREGPLRKLEARQLIAESSRLGGWEAKGKRNGYHCAEAKHVHLLESMIPGVQVAAGLKREFGATGQV